MIHAAREDLEHRVHRFRRGHAQAVHKTALDAALPEIARQLLAAAMHHHQFGAVRARRGDLRRQGVALRRGIEQRAAELDQRPHSRPSVSASPSIRFIFWMAWPAAPFTRLSMALTTTARPVLGSTVAPMSQKFVRATDRRSGVRPGLYSRRNGSCA